jgi:hypothetical protein
VVSRLVKSNISGKGQELTPDGALPGWALVVLENAKLWWKGLIPNTLSYSVVRKINFLWQSNENFFPASVKLRTNKLERMSLAMLERPNLNC